MRGVLPGVGPSGFARRTSAPASGAILPACAPKSSPMRFTCVWWASSRVTARNDRRKGALCDVGGTRVHRPQHGPERPSRQTPHLLQSASRR